MTDAANSGADTGATGNPENQEHTQGTIGDQMGASGESAASAAGDESVTQQQQYDDRAPYNQQTQQTVASVIEELGWAQGESPAGAEGSTQPNVRGADQPTATFPRRNPEPGNEDDPEGTNLIPPVSTGEERWVHAQVGALDSEGGKDWTDQVGTVTGSGAPGLVSQPGGEAGQGEIQDTNPEYAGIQGGIMGSTSTIQGAPFEGGNEGPPTEAYGQGETRQFAPRGAEPGIEQQEVLQSQQYEREEQGSRQGILGTVGDMLGALFGNAKRPPAPPPADKDEGESAGEAHP